METAPDILLLGNSVRYLAQSACGAGWLPCSVDLFADSDTQRASRCVSRAAADGPQALYDAVPSDCASAGTPWVYGAGFEGRPDLLRALCQRNPQLYGNDPQVVEQVADARAWMRMASELGIPVPTSSDRAPADRRGWLFKGAGGYGGMQVRVAKDAVDDGGQGHYQRFVKGPLASLLFAADGGCMVPIGFNRLYARNPAAGDFRFAAVVSGYRPGAAVRDVMLSAARRLTEALGLRGVNGLDFVVCDGQPLVLELNVRPPASLELYETSLRGGGLHCHVEACAGRLPESSNELAYRGLHIVYARQRQRLGDVAWPDYVADRPPVGTLVLPDEPLCSVHAHGPDEVTVLARLRQALDDVHEMVQRHRVEAA